MNGDSRIVCPNCQLKGTKTSTGRTPYLVNGRYCVVCGYKFKPVDRGEVRRQAATKAAITRANAKVEPAELFK